MSVSQQRRRLKRSTACTNCWAKKLKCDDEKPKCSNCARRSLDCVPHVPASKPRPTISRIQELEAQVQALEARLRDASQSCEPGGLPNQPPNTSQPTPLTSALPHPAEAPELRHSGYHGPTSALFDEIPQTIEDGDQESKAHDDSLTPALIAETARQRHMEAINLSSNRLDFDGVDSHLGTQMLSLYWGRQLHAGLIVYRPAFMRDMACGGPYFSKLLLNAMYYSVSKHCPSESIRKVPGDISTAGWLFRQRFIELLRDEYDKSRITTIQALLIMASSLFTRCDERSISWLYAGNAFNMLIDLGLHVKTPVDTYISSLDKETHRRVFWAAFMIDKIQCLYQGRQPSLRRSESNVPLVFSDDFEEYEIFDPAPFSDNWQFGAVPCHNVTLLTKYCQLCILMERVQHDLYAVQQGIHAATIKYSSRLKAELEAWRQSLPPELDFRPTESVEVRLLPFNLSLLALYNVLMILVHRPLLSEPRALQIDSGMAQAAFATCISSAEEITHILQVYATMFRPRSATFSLSYATYISAHVHVRVLARHPNPSTLRSLKVCLDALEQHQTIYSASRRAKAIIHHLIKRNGVDGIETESSASAAETTAGEAAETAESLHMRDPSVNAMALQYLEGPESMNSQSVDLPNGDAMLNFNLESMAHWDDQWHSLLHGPIFHDIYTDDRTMIDIPLHSERLI